MGMTPLLYRLLLTRMHVWCGFVWCGMVLLVEVQWGTGLCGRDWAQAEVSILGTALAAEAGVGAGVCVCEGSGRYTQQQ